MQSAVISPQKKWPRSSYHAVTIIPYWMWATWLLRVARGRPWLPSCVQTGLRTPAIGTTRPWHFHFFLHSKYKKSPHTSTFGWLHPVLLIWYVPTLMGDAIRLLWHSCWMTTRPRECVLHSLRFSEKMLVPGVKWRSWPKIPKWRWWNIPFLHGKSSMLTFVQSYYRTYPYLLQA